jgi:hypothetical protein
MLGYTLRQAFQGWLTVARQQQALKNLNVKGLAFWMAGSLRRCFQTLRCDA